MYRAISVSLERELLLRHWFRSECVLDKEGGCDIMLWRNGRVSFCKSEQNHCGDVVSKADTRPCQTTRLPFRRLKKFGLDPGDGVELKSGNPVSILFNKSKTYTLIRYVALQSITGSSLLQGSRQINMVYSGPDWTLGISKSPAGCGGETKLCFSASYPHLLTINPMLLISSQQARTNLLYL